MTDPTTDPADPTEQAIVIARDAVAEAMKAPVPMRGLTYLVLRIGIQAVAAAGLLRTAAPTPATVWLVGDYDDMDDAVAGVYATESSAVEATDRLDIAEPGRRHCYTDYAVEGVPAAPADDDKALIDRVTRAALATEAHAMASIAKAVGLSEEDDPEVIVDQVRALAAAAPADDAQPKTRERGELWEILDWSLWGNGMADVFRAPLADKMIAALTDAEYEQAAALIDRWRELRGEQAYRKLYEDLRAEIERLKASQPAPAAQPDDEAAVERMGKALIAHQHGVPVAECEHDPGVYHLDAARAALAALGGQQQ
jgi:hypothetical protein